MPFCGKCSWYRNTQKICSFVGNVPGSAILALHVLTIGTLKNIIYYMELEWNEQKNIILQKSRNISFERITVAIEKGNLLRILRHPNKVHFSHQYLLIVLIEQYVYVVPAIPTDNGFFLKTAYPSRKYTKLYMQGKGVYHE